MNAVSHPATQTATTAPCWNRDYCMADEALPSHIPISTGNIHRIPDELPAEEAAQDYEDELRRFFGGETPRFNLVLLGLGVDGHTASLFPGTPAVREKVLWVAAVSRSVPPPPLVERVTLTLPVLNAAAQVLFLVSGAEKAERLAQVLHGPSQPDLLPAQAVPCPVREPGLLRRNRDYRETGQRCRTLAGGSGRSGKASPTTISIPCWNRDYRKNKNLATFDARFLAIPCSLYSSFPSSLPEEVCLGAPPSFGCLGALSRYCWSRDGASG